MSKINSGESTTLRITQEDIDSGVKLEPGSCPVAHAFHRLGYPRILVGRVTAYVQKPKERWLEIPLPDSLIRFISRFDGGQPVEPGDHELGTHRSVTFGRTGGEGT